MQSNMIILGIDPGYDRLGIAVIEKPKVGKEKVLFSECFSTSKENSIYTRLNEIGSEVVHIIDKFDPKTIALETLFITKNQKTAMRVAEARGIIIYEAIRKGLQIFEYSPMEIKMAITGSGSSTKDGIIKMIHLLTDIKRKKLDDEYDAIAVALTCSAKYRVNIQNS